jgi:hypothetical protein
MLSQNKYYISIDQLLNQTCPFILTRKYKNVKNVVLYADLWNNKPEKVGYIQFFFNALRNDKIETSLNLNILDLNLSLKTFPKIGLDQSIIDYISLVSSFEFKNSSNNSDIIINIDNYIKDIDPLTNISPGITYCLSVK